MAMRRHASGARRGRSGRTAAPVSRKMERKSRPFDHPYGVPVPTKLREAIEIERDNLAKVESILACLVVSMECGADPLKGPYFPSVAQTARELLERSINGLDPFTLRQRLQNKIEEELVTSLDLQLYSVGDRASSRQALVSAC